MPALPTRFAAAILTFSPLLVHRSWRHAQALPIGAILCPGRRTVASILRTLGRAHDRRFVNLHCILTPAPRDALAAVRRASRCRQALRSPLHNRPDETPPHPPNPWDDALCNAA